MLFAFKEYVTNTILIHAVLAGGPNCQFMRLSCFCSYLEDSEVQISRTCNGIIMIIIILIYNGK